MEKQMFRIDLWVDPNREYNITGEQMMALTDIATRYRATFVSAGIGALSLSDSYIGFSLYEGTGAEKKHLLSGGIDQEGRIST